MKMSDLVVSRAGSNSIFEFQSLKKPMLLIPLSKAQSRGDQLLNAQSFYKSGFCEVLQEEDLTDENLLIEINNLYINREKFIEKMSKFNPENVMEQILPLITRLAEKERWLWCNLNDMKTPNYF